MLTKQFSDHIGKMMLQDFTTLPQVKAMVDGHISRHQPLIIQNQDEDQVWTQLVERINKVLQTTQKDIQSIEKKAAQVADAVVEEEQQEDVEEEDIENIEDVEDVEQDIEEEQDEQDVEQVEDAYNDDDVNQEEMDKYEEQFNQYAEEQDDEFMDDEDDENENEDDENENNNNNQDYNNDGEDSVFDEMREEGLDKDDEEEIDQLEHKMTNQKGWQMKGEVTAKQRPTNSLLEQDLDYQINRTKIQEPVEQVSSKLEDLIKKRVQDELFDDRQKVQLSLQQDRFKKNEVDTNKSQFGLADIYERQFKATLGLPTNTSEQKLKQELYNGFRELCYQLDSLSNLNFEPRGYSKQAEVKLIEDNVVAKEEKVPLTMRGNIDAGKITVEKPKMGLLSKEEANTEENKRSRRTTKQRLRNNLREKRQKGLIKQLETKGETKFMYNQAEKGRKQLQQLNSKIKNQESVKFDKTSTFFKNLQTHKIQKEKKK